ncbi:MAG: ParA family protein, partial [Campylobacter sp.]|nr:ParA family protein [Campylobacter sp.]
MNIISVFNNKGGVGKSTLCYHLAYALKEIGKRVLLMDLDPQCNLTIYGIKEKQLEEIWNGEEKFIEDYSESFKKYSESEIIKKPHSIHFLLKATEEG